MGLKLFTPVLVPSRVSVRAPPPPRLPRLAKESEAPLAPELSRVPVEVKVNRRSIATLVLPAYCNVPLLRDRLGAALLAAPMLLLTPPLARLVAANTPEEIYTPPVKALLPLVRVRVPPPTLSNWPALLVTEPAMVMA